MNIYATIVYKFCMCGNVRFYTSKERRRATLLECIAMCCTADVHTHESGGDMGMTSNELGPRTLELEFPQFPCSTVYSNLKICSNM